MILIFDFQCDFDFQITTSKMILILNHLYLGDLILISKSTYDDFAYLCVYDICTHTKAGWFMKVGYIYIYMLCFCWIYQFLVVVLFIWKLIVPHTSFTVEWNKWKCARHHQPVAGQSCSCRALVHRDKSWCSHLLPLTVS